MRCGCLADVRHVVMGECKGANGTDVYLHEMCCAMQALSKAIPRREATLAKPICDWQCECVRVVRRALAAFEDRRARREVRADGVDAVVRVLAGVYYRNVERWARSRYER